MLLLTVFLLFVSHVLSQEGCLIDQTRLSYPQPIVIRGYTNDFIYPPPENTVGFRGTYLSWGEIIAIACPGGKLNTAGHRQMEYAACNIRSELIVEEKQIDFNTLNCTTERTETTVHTGIPCGTGFHQEIVLVGYNLENITFVSLFEVCFDLLAGTPLYSSYHIPQVIQNQALPPATHFVEDREFYNFDLSFDEIYDENRTRAAINAQVGLFDFDERYVSSGRPLIKNFLLTGTELFYSYQKEAAFRGINSWPQWNLFCSNWNYIHDDIKAYATNNKVDLEIITGTHGITQLLHSVTREFVDIYMYEDEFGKSVPIPAAAWRLVHDPKTRRAIVLVSVNSPHAHNVDNNILCNDISSIIPWLSWNSNVGHDSHDILCGYSYACTYYDFKKAVPYIPDLDIIDILN